MILLHKSSEYKTMPWKNGQGVTAEIAIFPPQAQFPDDPFLWRLSSATVKAENHFSYFKDYDRLLTVIAGEGLLLNGVELLPFQIRKFSGEDKMHCALIDGEGKDLGLIFKRDEVQAAMKQHACQEGKKTFHFPEGLHFIFCGQGEFALQDLRLQAGDCLEVEGPCQLEFQFQKPTNLIWVTVQDLKT